MYHTFFYFRRLSAALSGLLPGARLIDCFSQEKDELVLGFLFEDNSRFFIKADLSQGASILSFPKNFGRTRSNSVDLFPEILGSVVTEVIQTKNDRSFHIQFANGLLLCFKMYGGRSNVLLHNGSEVLQVFNHHLKKDLESGPPQDKDLDQSRTAFDANYPNLKALFPTFDKWIWSYWEEKTFALSPDGQWHFLQAMLQQMETGPFFLCRLEDEVMLSFFEVGDVLESINDPIEAGNAYYQYYWQVNRFEKQKAQLLGALDQQIFHANQQLKSAEKQWISAHEAIGYRQQADLLMAFGFQLEKGAVKAVFPSFLDGKPVEIKLKRELSVAANAERLYKKGKGQQADLERLEHRISLWQTTISGFSEQRNALSTVENWAGLKPFLAEQKTTSTETENLPYHKLLLLDFEIWVGKSAKSNDELLRLAHKDDLWLHARNVPGSHAIVRHRKGKIVPQSVVERAAQLAAFYSKAKTESLVSVMVTERKFVRKNKSMAPGQVRVEREKTILVAPLGL